MIISTWLQVTLFNLMEAVRGYLILPTLLLLLLLFGWKKRASFLLNNGTEKKSYMLIRLFLTKD